MLKKYFVCFMVLAFGSLFAQQISPSVINTAGTYFLNGSAQLDFNVGEPAITIIGDGNNGITQGFLQPKAIVNAIEDIQAEYNFIVFPNPTTDHFIVNSSSYTDMLTVKLVDFMGRIVLNSSSNNNAISITEFPVGIYQILILDKNQNVLSRKTITKI